MAKTFGWWSPNAYQANGKCHIYERPDGTFVAVTIVSSVPVYPYVNGWQDGQYVGELVRWIVNPPVSAPFANQLITTPPIWLTRSSIPYQIPVQSANVAPTPIAQKACDCSLAILMRGGCKNPQHF